MLLPVFSAFDCCELVTLYFELYVIPFILIMPGNFVFVFYGVCSFLRISIFKLFLSLHILLSILSIKLSKNIASCVCAIASWMPVKKELTLFYTLFVLIVYHAYVIFTHMSLLQFTSIRFNFLSFLFF